MNLDTAFLAVYGRAPSPEETNSFNRIGKELDIRDNDAIWAIAFLLGHHLDLAIQMPEQIDKLISQSLAKYRSSLDSARRLAETDLAATKARIEESVGQAVVTSAQKEIARAAQTVAQITARKSWLQWLGCAAITGMLLIGGAVYWGYTIGNTNGYARSLDVKAVSAWARTENISCALCVLPAMVLFLAGTSRRLLGKEKHDYRGSSVEGSRLAVGHRVSGA